jgi:hypothetical protein
MCIPKGIVVNALGKMGVSGEAEHLRSEVSRQGMEQLLGVENNEPRNRVRSEGVFYHCKAAYILYSDDSILAGPVGMVVTLSCSRCSS